MQPAPSQYAPCFESLSPPIPAEAKELFCVNGQLLQGYSLARPVPKRERVTLDDLLECLEDGDLVEAAPMAVEAPPPAATKEQMPKTVQAQPAAPKPSPTKATRPTDRKKPLHKKRLAMAR